MLHSSLIRAFVVVVGAVFFASPSFAQTILISEFMADNGVTIVDEDGDSSDWIELHNSGLTAVSLDGWYLTDDADELTRWRIPDVTIDPQGFLLLFASGKDRSDPGSELHTNYSHESNGESRALVVPNGAVHDDFGERFPRQLSDHSYGVSQEVSIESLVEPDANARYFVPRTLFPVDAGWEQPGFDDSSWDSGVLGFGYVQTVPGFRVTNIRATADVRSLGTAESVFDDPGLQGDVFEENAPYIDYYNTGGRAHYTNDRLFPGFEDGVDENDFVTLVEGVIDIPFSGSWTFGVNSDDGFSLDLTRGPTSFHIEYPTPRGPADTLGVFNVPEAGSYNVRLLFYEAGGGAGVEFFAARGSRSTWDAANFRLVGDVENGGLEARSELATIGSLGAIEEYLQTDLESEIYSVSSQLHVRIPFQTLVPEDFESAKLRIRYDDGVVCWLNGVEIARRNAPVSLAAGETAPEDRDISLNTRFEDIDVTEHLDLLNAGDNLLAIQAFNSSADSGDFLVYAELAEIETGSGALSYFSEATPGEANSEAFVGVVGDTSFSVDRGFFEFPFELEIRSETPGATIRYTTNGSEPTLTNGFTYNNPLQISRTTTVRAAAFLDDFLPTNVDTQTYIFLDDIVNQTHEAVVQRGFPENWGGTPADYGLDQRVVGQNGSDAFGGLYAQTIKDDLKSIPTLSIVMDMDQLFGPGGIYTNSTSRGVTWERPISLELIHPNGQEGFQLNAGVRIQGNAFRRHNLTKKHSFRVLFKRIYGPTKLRYPLFGDRAVDEFDTLTLRANANDSWRFSTGSSALYIKDSFG
ncbi:MAG: FN3 associated domain-containing protein, partial [Planctomycetota bacterium]